jgi:DNA-binding PadR family transcriptional regulator
MAKGDNEVKKSEQVSEEGASTEAFPKLVLAAHLILAAAKSQTKSDLNRGSTILLSILSEGTDEGYSVSELEQQFRSVLAASAEDKVATSRFGKAMNRLERKGLVQYSAATGRYAISEKGAKELRRVSRGVDEALQVITKSLGKRTRRELLRLIKTIEVTTETKRGPENFSGREG